MVEVGAEKCAKFGPKMMSKFRTRDRGREFPKPHVPLAVDEGRRLHRRTTASTSGPGGRGKAPALPEVGTIRVGTIRVGTIRPEDGSALVRCRPGPLEVAVVQTTVCLGSGRVRADHFRAYFRGLHHGAHRLILGNK